ncbi:MAG TPA: hypothetical protein VKA86_13480 [Candidatus Krumholzibacteria bacterium]|nr:hypothetical protein [Candidatus Krumholzibacteria bacterium]
MIAAAALGALAGLDRTAFGQTALANPFVAACLSAWIAGVPGQGVWLGIGLLLLSVARIPVGEQRVRDWTSAAVAAPWWAGPDAGPERWALALLLSVALAHLAGRIVGTTRAMVGRWVEDWRETDETSVGPTALHLRCTALHALRGGLVVGAAVPVGGAFLDLLVPRLDTAEVTALARFWELAPIALLPLLWRFHGDLGRARHQWSALLLGFAVGLALLVLGTEVPS